MTFDKLKTVLPLLIGVALVQAQSRPGIDRPIRVGMFKGIGSSGEVFHTNTHTASTVMAAMLANPASANLGDSLVIPSAGFSFYSMPIKLDAGGAECSSVNCKPTPEQMLSIVASLDTLDVLIMNSNIQAGAMVTDSSQRQAFETFWATKGLISIHATTDSKNSWAQLDTIHGTRFNNFPLEQVATIRRDSVHQGDSAWQYLNRGLFSNGTDTSFVEEFLFWTNSGAEIRARANLTPTVKLVEAGMTNINALAMGDHPMSWYRHFPTGGRTFYTGLGHRAQVWQTTRTFRRQIYNAILWAAKYDSVVNVTSITPDRNTPRDARLNSRITVTPGALTVTTLQPGTHIVDLLRLDGTRVDTQKGSGFDKTYQFTALRSGVYVVTVSSAISRSSRLVAVP